MRKIVLALVLLAFGCGSPCRDQKIAAALLGGPIGIIFAAAWQCGEEAPPQEPQPIAAVAAAGLQAPEPVLDMALPADLAKPSPPDLASPADLATPPPDLSPVSVPLALSSPQDWALSGPVSRSGDDFVVKPAFDFVRGKAVDATFDMPIAALPQPQGQPKRFDMTFTVDVDVAWGPPATPAQCAAQPRFYLKSGTTSTCLQPIAALQVLADGVVVWDSGRRLEDKLPQRLTFAPQPGGYVSVTPGQRLSYRLLLDGDVVVKSVAAETTVTESF